MAMTYIPHQNWVSVVLDTMSAARGTQHCDTEPGTKFRVKKKNPCGGLEFNLMVTHLLLTAEKVFTLRDLLDYATRMLGMRGLNFSL